MQHYTIGALGFVLKIRASLDTREQEDDGRIAVITQLRHSAAEAQALEGGRQARRLGRASTCLATGILTATDGLEALPVNQALGAIAEREAALVILQKKRRRWSLEDEEATLHEEAVQHGRLSAAVSACAWLSSAADSRPREQEWIAQCGRIAAAERLAAEAALTAAISRARVARKHRDLSHSYVAQMAGLRRARQLAQTAVAGTSERSLTAAHHRVWREAVRSLRRESEFQQLMAEHFTQRAACSLVDRTVFLARLHSARGELMARNIVEQTNIVVAQQMNENLTLQLDSAMFGTTVASLLPTVKWHNAESACREGTKTALQTVADERQRCASAELHACQSACSLALAAEEHAFAEQADAEKRLGQGQDALAAAKETLISLQARLAELVDLERAQGGTRDPVSRTVQGLEKTDGELTRSWTNLQDALAAEISGEAASRHGEVVRRDRYQLKKPLRTSSASTEDNRNDVGMRTDEEKCNTSSPVPGDAEVIELGSESTSEEDSSPSSREELDDEDSAAKAMEILQGLGRPQLQVIDLPDRLNRESDRVQPEADEDIDELRLMLIPSAEATVEDCQNDVRILQEELRRKQALLQDKMQEHEEAEVARTRALRDHGREALRLDSLKQSEQLDREIAELNSSLTEYNIADRELRLAKGALTYVMKVSDLADPAQSLQSADDGEHAVASFQGARSRQAPPRSFLMLRWVREGIHVSDYIAHYAGAGRQLRLEFIAHRASNVVSELCDQGYDELANLHEKIELEACQILMDDLKACCQAMVAIFKTYTEADQMLTAAKELFQQGKNDEDDRKMNQANEDMQEVLPVLQVTREQMMKQRADAPLYRAIATQVNGRLGAAYTLDENDDKVRVCALRRKAVLRALHDAEAALQKAKDDAKAAVKAEKEMSKEHARAKYSAERAEAAGEEAYKKDDYTKERQCREKAKELWVEAEEFERKLAAATELCQELRAAVDIAQAVVVSTRADLVAAEKALRLTEIEAKDGWLAKTDEAVATVETFCTSQHLIDAGLKNNHGDMVGAASSFVRWHRHRASSSSRRQANNIEFRHGVNAMITALGSVIQRDLPSAQNCAEHRTWIVSVRCPKDVPKDGQFVVVERKSFVAADGSLRVDERHKPFGDHKFDFPDRECIDKDGTFKTKVPITVASRNGELEGLTNQEAFGLVNDLSGRMMKTFGSSAQPEQLSPAARTSAEMSQLLVCRALGCLLQGEFANAAGLLLSVHATSPDCSQVACTFADHDVAMCATLCSLACGSLSDIQERLLGAEFSAILTQADPIVRELACEFVSGNLRAVETSLDALSVRMAYDPFLSEYRTALVDAIRSRCCDLATPFVDNAALLSVKCRERARAAVDSARFRTDAMAAASELDVVKVKAAAAKKAASKAVADFHDLSDDRRVKTKMRNIFSRASAKAIAQTRFQAADIDSSGTIDIRELENIAEALGHKLTPQQLRRVVEEVDADGNGELDYNEFMVWYSKEFGEKLQMSQAHEARARLATMAKTAEAQLKIETSKRAAEEAFEQVRQVEAEVAHVKKNAENAARSRRLVSQRQIVRANLVLYYRLPCTSNASDTQHAARLMLEDLDVAMLEAQMMDELNVRLSCMERRYEAAMGGIIFQHGIDAEVQEQAVLEEVAAGGWSVDGILLSGNLRASAETKLSLVHIGSALGDELAWRIANQRLASAETARSALAVVLDAEHGTFKPTVARVEGKVSCNPQVVEVTKEAVVALLDAKLERAISAQGEYSAAELDRRRTKQTQRAMQAVVTDREQHALLQILNAALEFAAADLQRKKTDTARAKEQEFNSLSAIAAARLADAREIHAGAVVEREKKEEDYEKMRDQLTQELAERDQLKTVAKISEREAVLQARMLADAVSQYDKKRIGSDKVDAEAAAAQDASKAQRQSELAIMVSEQTDKAKKIMLAARKEEQVAASAIEECKAAELHANQTCGQEWAEHARRKELREGPLFAATLEKLRARLHDTQLALKGGKIDLQNSMQLAVQSQADFLQEHAVKRLLHTAHRLWDEQATERLKERNHAVIRRAALSGQVWADKSELFHKTDERVLADEVAATKEKALALAVATHSAASTEMSGSEVYCLQTKQTFTDTKQARTQVQYLLEREEATLSRLQHQRVAGRPASASAITKWRADLERLTTEAEQQKVLYADATARLERARVALGVATAALAVAQDEAEEAVARATSAAKKEMQVQQTVAQKLQSLVRSGLVFTSERTENEFKALLFRKILDGSLGTKWSKEDEARFRELFCGEHLRGPTSPAGLTFKKIRA